MIVRHVRLSYLRSYRFREPEALAIRIVIQLIADPLLKAIARLRCKIRDVISLDCLRIRLQFAKCLAITMDSCLRSVLRQTGYALPDQFLNLLLWSLQLHAVLVS